MSSKALVAKNRQREKICKRFFARRMMLKSIIKMPAVFSADDLLETDTPVDFNVFLKRFSLKDSEIVSLKKMMDEAAISWGCKSGDAVLFLRDSSYMIAAYPLKEKASSVLNLLSRDSSAVRVRNRCSITGRPRGCYRYFGISRSMLRSMSLSGLLPGVKKYSW